MAAIISEAGRGATLLGAAYRQEQGVVETLYADEELEDEEVASGRSSAEMNRSASNCGVASEPIGVCTSVHVLSAAAPYLYDTL
mmetsp:Transcript_69571/g.192548  ORF Transcript_69571/g.192548 Transcript_69571/m.192548 type:complete len:84 (-) Transcript_69571:75-326(-)